jgi:hypothetical protein
VGGNSVNSKRNDFFDYAPERPLETKFQQDADEGGERLSDQRSNVQTVSFFFRIDFERIKENGSTSDLLFFISSDLQQIQCKQEKQKITKQKWRMLVSHILSIKDNYTDDKPSW